MSLLFDDMSRLTTWFANRPNAVNCFNNSLFLQFTDIPTFYFDSFETDDCVDSANVLNVDIAQFHNFHSNNDTDLLVIDIASDQRVLGVSLALTISV